MKFQFKVGSIVLVLFLYQNFLFDKQVLAQENLIESLNKIQNTNTLEKQSPGIVNNSSSETELRSSLTNIGQEQEDILKLPSTSTKFLVLEDVLDIVKTNHPKLRGANVERLIASAKFLEKQGAFDPSIIFSNSYLLFNKFDGKKAKAIDATANELSIDFLTRSGIKFSAGVRYNSLDVKSPSSPTGQGGEYFLAFKAPLLRGRGINEKSAAEQQAKLGEPLAEISYQQTRLDLLLKASISYWDWVAAKRKVDIAQRLLDIAKVRFTAISQRADLGDLPPIDKIEAEQEVQRRDGSLVKADRDLQKAAFKLSLFLWESTGQPSKLPSAERAPHYMRSPALLKEEEILRGRALALQERPELKSIGISRDIVMVDLNLAKQDRLPVLDLTVSPGQDTGNNGVGTTLKAGVLFSLPVRQRTVDGRLAAAQLKIQKLSLEEQLERQRILTEVEDAISAISMVQKRYLVTEQEYQLAVTLERGERDRFALGDSTLFLVNQRERATAEAANKVIEVQAEYEQSIATFLAATAQL